MPHRILTSAMLIVWASTVPAQSVITLDDFKLDDDTSTAEAAAPQTPGSEMEACLFDQSNCSNAEFRSGSGLSLDDVVNIGIIDRTEVQPSVAAAPAATGGDDTVPAARPTASADPLPSIDIEILFDSGSDDIRPQEFRRLVELSYMLAGARFDDYRFLFLGHTDAKGSDDFNMTLSSRRAESVAAAVRGISGFGPERVFASGLGETRLKDPTQPEGGINRRVQLLLLPR